MAAVWDDPENDELYRAQVRGLLADLHGFSNRMTKFGRLFGDQTTARIDLSRPVDFDISALAQSGDDVVAAVLATTWTSAFAAKNAADVLAEEGLQPRRNHVIIMDEMHRALRASPLMVEKLDLLTRLNRQWGVGQIMITHTFKDLMCMETPAQNTKARGFVERSEIKVLGALSRIEVDRYLRGECGLPVSRREEDMLEDWATPVNFGSDASHKGLGRFLIKLGGLPGIPINVEMCPLEKAGSTIRTSNGTPRREPCDDRPPRHRHETHDPRRGTLRIPLRPARRAIPAAAADGQPQHSRLPPRRARRILMGLRNVDNPHRSQAVRQCGNP